MEFHVVRYRLAARRGGAVSRSPWRCVAGVFANAVLPVHCAPAD